MRNSKHFNSNSQNLNCNNTWVKEPMSSLSPTLLDVPRKSSKKEEISKMLIELSRSHSASHTTNCSQQKNKATPSFSEIIRNSSHHNKIANCRQSENSFWLVDESFKLIPTPVNNTNELGEANVEYVTMKQIDAISPYSTHFN